MHRHDSLSYVRCIAPQLTDAICAAHHGGGAPPEPLDVPAIALVEGPAVLRLSSASAVSPPAGPGRSASDPVRLGSECSTTHAENIKQGNGLRSLHYMKTDARDGLEDCMTVVKQPTT